jgi:hypothetical protein
MRRVVGAWLLFCLVSLPNTLDEPFVMTGRQLIRRWLEPAGREKVLSGGNALPGSHAYEKRQFIPRVNVFPIEKRASLQHEVPLRFIREPLEFFSTAPPESLALLPGIGPVLAARVCDARGGKGSFSSWDDLRRIKGIGEKTVSKLERLSRKKQND